jgi:hypothetical protein
MLQLQAGASWEAPGGDCGGLHAESVCVGRRSQTKEGAQGSIQVYTALGVVASFMHACMHLQAQRQRPTRAMAVLAPRAAAPAPLTGALYTPHPEGVSRTPPSKAPE